MNAIEGFFVGILVILGTIFSALFGGTLLWLLWNPFGIGVRFFSFLPEVYHHTGYWETIGLFWVLALFGSLIKSVK